MLDNHTSVPLQSAAHAGSVHHFFRNVIPSPLATIPVYALHTPIDPSFLQTTLSGRRPIPVLSKRTGTTPAVNSTSEAMVDPPEPPVPPTPVHPLVPDAPFEIGKS